MASADWDARYRESGLVWGAQANRFVVQYTADLPAGRAVDLACGEGRNSLYLAGRGWQVTGVDFSAVALDKARAAEQALSADADGAQHPIRWVCADVGDYRPDPVDLVLLAYLHLPRAQWREALLRGAAALAPGGRILLVGHNTRNITEGSGGPQNPDVLYTASDAVQALGEGAPDLVVEVALEPHREVPGADRPAIDTVVLARRP
jgi:SAM-dependent methyltransferase